MFVQVKLQRGNDNGEDFLSQHWMSNIFNFKTGFSMSVRLATSFKLFEFLIKQTAATIKLLILFFTYILMVWCTLNNMLSF